MALHLLVGLGNPGSRYAATRHNVGFMVVELLAKRWSAGSWQETCGSSVAESRSGESVRILAKPQLFMNRSGLAVGALLDCWGSEIGSLLVIHDDLDLPFGVLRIRSGGGHGGHNGLRSILEVVGSGEFPRLKIGIGKPPLREDVVDHVLSPFSPDEAVDLGKVLVRAADAAEAVLLEGPVKAMNRFHS